MTCTSYDLGGGVSFIGCGPRRPKRMCKACKQNEATILCDEPLLNARSGRTCSAPLCSRCAVEVAPERHLCPPHARHHASKDSGRVAAERWLADLIADELGHEAVERARRTSDVPISDKVRHVKRASQTRTHHCHWPDCNAQVPPARWGCFRHWSMLPKELRDKIWAAYRPGQEDTMTPSREYVHVAREVQDWIKSYLGREERKKRPRADVKSAVPGPHELWKQAEGDGQRYRELMIEHGHLVRRGDALDLDGLRTIGAVFGDDVGHNPRQGWDD